MEEATLANEDKRNMEMEGKMTWPAISGGDRKMIRDGRGSEHGPVANIVETRQKGEKS